MYNTHRLFQFNSPWLNVPVIVLIIMMVLGCMGQAPSISNYMMKSNAALTYTDISGDIHKEESIGTDLYKKEWDLHESIGLYIDGDLSVGCEFGTAGLTPLLGYKLKHFGAVSWLNLNRDLWTGGLGISEYYRGRYGSIGALQYLSKNTITKYYQEAMSMDITYYDGDKYLEAGAGIYGGFILMDLWGLSGEYRAGFELTSWNVRHYLSISMNWNLPLKPIRIKN